MASEKHQKSSSAIISRVGFVIIINTIVLTAGPFRLFMSHLDEHSSFHNWIWNQEIRGLSIKSTAKKFEKHPLSIKIMCFH